MTAPYKREYAPRLLVRAAFVTGSISLISEESTP
jgi:hypothetical protein